MKSENILAVLHISLANPRVIDAGWHPTDGSNGDPTHLMPYQVSDSYIDTPYNSTELDTPVSGLKCTRRSSRSRHWTSVSRDKETVAEAQLGRPLQAGFSRMPHALTPQLKKPLALVLGPVLNRHGNA